MNISCSVLITKEKNIFILFGFRNMGLIFSTPKNNRNLNTFVSTASGSKLGGIPKIPPLDFFSLTFFIPQLILSKKLITLKISNYS